MGDNMSKRLKLISATDAEMEERSFSNPYPDWDQGVLTSNSGADVVCNDSLDSEGKVSTSFQKKVQSKIKDLLQQMEEGLKTADPHDFSTYTGWTGIALLYLQLHRVSNEASYLHRALDYVKRTMRILNGRKVTFLCGDAGPLAVGAVVHHKLNNTTDSKECLSRLLQLQRSVLSPDSDIPDELLYGRAGYLYALLYVNKEIGTDAVDEDTITKVVTAIVESGKNMSAEQKKTDRCPLLYEWHKKQYIGAAHGLAGIYYMLMQSGAKVHPDILSELVRPSIDYVRHKRFRSGNFPSSLSNESDRLVHWCHGAPGVIHMLIMAHKIFKEEKYLKEAVDCGEVIWQRGLLRKGYGICHGTAGNGYAFLSLYKLTKEKKYLHRACKFAEWCLDYGTHGCRIPDRPYSLFEGMAGALHYISEMENPEASCFPAFEL
ncbi:lanC-like protein 2 [Maylandia zebra]|uniref:LanC-like protein 2 n=5 Tax=Haplochromini TaxID=319058 RepID=A0A9Y3RQM2_9CICH|nr:lanC-like protein 2 [Maylandia zebra]XP_005747529.1 PREDICTED: lanC-like protein 2 isoform X1 [Pundamilia nyererei]XP_026035917.1 lanC-like protein 2 [Astatotilapia calliptera]